MKNIIKEQIINEYNNNNYNYEDKKIKYDKFKNLYSKDSISSLEGKELLYRFFAPKKFFETKRSLYKSLIYNLEFVYKEFGSLRGVSSYKFDLHFSEKNNSWITSSKEKVSEEKAIEITTIIRDSLVKWFDLIENTSFRTIEDYENFKNLKNYNFSLLEKWWVLKYLHILYPEKFSCFYTKSNLDKILDKMEIKKGENNFIKNGQLALIANELEIHNVFLNDILLKLNLFTETKKKKKSKTKLKDEIENIKQDFVSENEKGENLIIYGTPGCGKSYYVDNVLTKNYSNKIRTTFYQDYSNTDFVGQILPIVEKERVSYEFNPGPFTLALEMAILNPNERVALIIEELNRGNASSIFGDIFQLLDRDDKGKSIYPIVNTHIIKYLNKNNNYELKEIRIPSNLSIFATMNTSDQNVFTLDTAFKRRWKYKKIINEFKQDHKFKDLYVPGADITWKDLVVLINNYMVENTDNFNNEDKQIGIYFINPKGMRSKIEIKSSDEEIEEFAYKFLEYLWSDVAKFQREKWFDPTIKTLDHLVQKYKEKGLEVFNKNVIERE